MFTLQHQLSPERAAGLRAHAGYGRSVMNRPQAARAAKEPPSIATAVAPALAEARATR